METPSLGAWRRQSPQAHSLLGTSPISQPTGLQSARCSVEWRWAWLMGSSWWDRSWRLAHWGTPRLQDQQGLWLQEGLLWSWASAWPCTGLPRSKKESHRLPLHWLWQGGRRSLTSYRLPMDGQSSPVGSSLVGSLESFGPTSFSMSSTSLTSSSRKCWISLWGLLIKFKQSFCTTCCP